TLLRKLDAQGNFIVLNAPSPLSRQDVQSLFNQSQDIPASPLARNGMVLGGPGSFDISARHMDLGISSGIRSIGALLHPALKYVSAAGANINVMLFGDLDVTSSQIASFSGGSIHLAAFGHLNIGSQDQFTSDDTPKGIYTGHGGDVTVEAGGDISISGSRGATYARPTIPLIPHPPPTDTPDIPPH